MDIRFVSTLTAEDEERVAEALLAGLVALLEGLPITYALRIETAGAKVFQQINMSDSEHPIDASPATVASFASV
jgi:hypothetical protein